MSNILLMFALPASNLGLGEAALISVVGVVLVMLVIALLMYAVKLMSLVVIKIEQKKHGVKPDKVQAKGEVQLVDVSEEDAALIMAIVADNSEVPLNQLKFVSIKKVEEK